MKPAFAKASASAEASADKTAGRLFAISDLHVSRRENFEALQQFANDAGRRHVDDWLIIAGDTGERVEHLVGPDSMAVGIK